MVGIHRVPTGDDETITPMFADAPEPSQGP
jgi:hypothetical protein